MCTKQSQNRLSGFLLILAAAFIAAACSAPVGVIDNPGKVSGDDALWAVPNRILYDLDERNCEFDSNNDLQVFASNKGAVQVVPINQVQIYIVENPNSPSPNKVLINNNGKYLFRSPGRKNVEIYYREMSTWYSVEVKGSTLGSSDDDFTNIIWF